MMKQYIAIVLALAAVAVQVHASPIATIEGQKLTLFKALADISGATGPLSSTKARVTILAPTDEAIKTFLKDMGITVDDLKAQETLADHILAYHIVLGVAASSEALFAKGKEVTVATAAAPYKITFKQGADGTVEAVDFQGNTARVTKANVGEGNHVVHVIDKVLYSGAYWNNLGDLVKRLPNYFSTVNAAAVKAGLASTLTATDFTDTLFLPTNKAFEKAGITLDAPQEKIAEVLKYHVVAGDRTIPKGFKSGEKVKTLEGQDISVSYKQGEKVNAQLVASTAYVTDASGNQVMVIHPNIFIGKAEAHVIDGVLMPKAAPTAAVTASPAGAVSAAPATITAAPEVTASKPAAAAATTSKPTAAAATTSKPTAAAADSTGKGSTFTIKKPFFTFTITTGRKMLQNVGTDASFTTSEDLDASEQAILNAVNSDASLSATAGAADANIANSELATQFGVYSTYADGIGGDANSPSLNGGGD